MLLLVGAAAPRGAAQFPTEPPPAARLEPLQFPPFQESRLGNGLALVLVEDHRLPIVSISLNLRAGSRHDPPGQEGLADMVAELITKGTKRRTAEQIAAEIEQVGASLNASAGSDFFSIGTTVLTEHVELAFDLISDVLLNATYPEEELELARRRALSAIRLAKSSPGQLASQFFQHALYGEHPYGRYATEQSVQAMTAESVRDYAATYLKPREALLVVAGDLTRAQARRLADRFLGAWRGAAPQMAATAPPPPALTGIILVHRPGSEQSNIRVGNLALRPDDETYYAAVVANKILGGGTDARLFMILREQKSWTYGAYSGIARRKDVGYFQANTEVRNNVTDSALVELLSQLRRMRGEAVPDSELAAAKGYLVGSFPLSIQTPQQIAGQVANVKLLGLGENYLRTYRQRLAQVTAAQVQHAAGRVINSDSLVIVVVGDGQAVYDRLTPIAAVRIIDVDGKPLQPEDLVPKVTEVTFDVALLAVSRDSFRVSVQGQEFGSFVTEVAHEGDALVYRERLAIPAAGVQARTTATMDAATLMPRSVESVQTQGGMSGETRLTYDGLNVTGTAAQPQPGGPPAMVEVDTTLAPGTLDQETLPVAMRALPLAEGASFTLSVFDASANTVRPATIAVAGAEEVVVPAGTFGTFRLEVTTGQQSFTYYVTRAAPRRVVKLEIVGQPVAFELLP